MAAHFMGASAPAKPPLARGHQSWGARNGTTPVCCRASRGLHFMAVLDPSWTERSCAFPPRTSAGRPSVPPAAVDMLRPTDAKPGVGTAGRPSESCQLLWSPSPALEVPTGAPTLPGLPRSRCRAPTRRRPHTAAGPTIQENQFSQHELQAS